LKGKFFYDFQTLYIFYGVLDGIFPTFYGNIILHFSVEILDKKMQLKNIIKGNKKETFLYVHFMVERFISFSKTFYTLSETYILN
jgi:hypothetical protein